MKKINKLFLAFIMLFATTVAFAQYKADKKIYLCDTDALPIDLGTQVLGIDASATGGQWREVDATDETKVLNSKASNVFKAIDVQPGTYVFIYEANEHNACADEGDKFKATVYVLETPKPVNVEVPLCEKETKELDLNTLISATLKGKYTISYKKANGTAITGGKLNILETDEGTINAVYELSGSDIAQSPCTVSATIAVNITREADYANKNFSGEKALCIDKMPEKLNLNAELGIGADIDWTAPSGAPAITDGTINLDNTTGSIATGTYVYNFTISAPSSTCGLNGKTGVYTLTITDDLSEAINKEKQKEICKKNTPNANVDMLSTLGIGVPQQSGVWEAADNATPEDYISNGFFDVSKAPAGTYKYQYRVSTAADLCGIGGKTSGILTFIVGDGGGVLDGTVQLCMANLPSNLNLSNYISGVTSAKWSDANGNAITNGIADVSSFDKGTYEFTYAVGTGDCESIGTLYISVVSELSNFTDRSVKYCLTDTGSEAIKLDGLLAVAGINGTWSGDTGNAQYDASNHSFNGREAGAGTYTFTFTADSNAGCGLANKTATITVIMTDTLAN